MFLRSVILIGLCLIAQVEAFKMKFADWSLPTYDKMNYRQHPYHRVGIFGPKSSASVLAGKKGHWATMDVDLKMSNSPHGVFQVYIYRADFVEGTLIPSLGDPQTNYNVPVIHPCMDFGQASGVFRLSNMTQDAYVLNSNHLTVRSAENTDTYLQGTVYLRNTGLYIISINACRWNTHATLIAGPHNTTRILRTRTLDTAGWQHAKIHGTISIKNPYGYLLGQEFGYMPAYATCMIISVVLLIVYLAQCIRTTGLWNLLRYQRVLLILAVGSSSSYILLCAYFFTINSHNEQNQHFFIAASVGLLVRSTFSRCVVYLLCAGWNVLRPTLPYEKWMFLGIFAVSHFGLSLGFFLLEHLHDRGTGGFDVADQPNLAIASVNIVTILLEIGLVVATWWEIRSTRRRLTRMQVPVKSKLYQRMYYVLVVYVLCSLAWLIFINLPSTPVSTDESSWQLWWLRGSVWELNYLWCYCVMLVLWMPGRMVNKYLALDQEQPDADSHPRGEMNDDVPRGETEEEQRSPTARFRAPRRSETDENEAIDADGNHTANMEVDYELGGNAAHPAAYEVQSGPGLGVFSSTQEDTLANGSVEMQSVQS